MGKTVPSASSPTGVVTADPLASPCQRQSARRRRYGKGGAANRTEAVASALRKHLLKI